MGTSIVLVVFCGAACEQIVFASQGGHRSSSELCNQNQISANERCLPPVRQGVIN